MDELDLNESAESPTQMGASFELIQTQFHCPICGSQLHFSHVTDFVNNMTQESARCPECGFKAPNMVHRLQ